jgi:hypothetical protein
MYENTLLSVKVNNIYLTDNFQSFVGVRQGDNLIPTFRKLSNLLFRIFKNNLPIQLPIVMPLYLEGIHVSPLLQMGTIIPFASN